MDANAQSAPAPQAANNAPTDSGMTENVAAAISYLFIIGLIFIFTEKKSKFVRFHAFQAVFFGVAWGVVSIIPILGWLISFLLLFVWFYLMYQAYLGNMFKLPVIGDVAEKQANNPVS